MNLAGDDASKMQFLHLNTAFAPDGSHKLSSWRTSSSSSPFGDVFDRLNSNTAPPSVRANAAELIEWCLENIPLSGIDRDTIKDHLKHYRATV